MTEHRRYPLAWPTGWKRTAPAQRLRADWAKTLRSSSVDGVKKTRAMLNVVDAATRLEQQLTWLGATHAILSTNVELRLDGRPRAGLSDPADPGAALYFKLKAKDRCLACDRWQRVADNINAISLHVDALRRIDRYGVGTMDQAFAGYTALPAAETDWRSVFGFNGTPNVTIDQVDKLYRALAREYHPDVGGDLELMARLNAARDAARKELASS